MPGMGTNSVRGIAGVEEIGSDLPALASMKRKKLLSSEWRERACLSRGG